jgi:ABC-type proline/glycine betaine transport system permease subunit
MLKRFLSETIKQLGDFIIFDCDHFLEAIKLNTEKLILIIYTFLQIFQLEIKYFLEFVPKLIELFTFLLIGLVTSNTLFFDEFLQTTNFLIFLISHLLHSALNNTLNILFFG